MMVGMEWNGAEWRKGCRWISCMKRTQCPYRLVPIIRESWYANVDKGEEVHEHGCVCRNVSLTHSHFVAEAGWDKQSR